MKFNPARAALSNPLQSRQSAAECEQCGSRESVADFDNFGLWSEVESLCKSCRESFFAQKIAIEFSRKIRNATTESELAEINRRNATPEYAGACATHDFMDSNVVMQSAFSDCTGRAVLGEHGMTETDAATWNEAWKIARAGMFALE